MNGIDYAALGKRIRTQRRYLRLTQEALAEAAGISLSFMGHIERGSRKASIDTLVTLANTLKLTPDILLQDSLANPPFPNNEHATKRQRELIDEISKIIIKKFEE